MLLVFCFSGKHYSARMSFHLSLEDRERCDCPDENLDLIFIRIHSNFICLHTYVAVERGSGVLRRDVRTETSQ